MTRTIIKVYYDRIPQTKEHLDSRLRARGYAKIIKRDRDLAMDVIAVYGSEELLEEGYSELELNLMEVITYIRGYAKDRGARVERIVFLDDNGVIPRD